MDTLPDAIAAAAAEKFPAWVIVTLMLAQAVIQPVIVSIINFRRSRSADRKVAAGEPALMWSSLSGRLEGMYEKAIARIEHLEGLLAGAEKRRLESIDEERRRMLEHCDKRMVELQLRIISELSAEIANGRVKLKPTAPDEDSPDERGDSSEDLLNRGEGGAA